MWNIVSVIEQQGYAKDLGLAGDWVVWSVAPANGSAGPHELRCALKRGGPYRTLAKSSRDFGAVHATNLANGRAGVFFGSANGIDFVDLSGSSPQEPRNYVALGSAGAPCAIASGERHLCWALEEVAPVRQLLIQSCDMEYPQSILTNATRVLSASQTMRGMVVGKQVQVGPSNPLVDRIFWNVEEGEGAGKGADVWAQWANSSTAAERVVHLRGYLRKMAYLFDTDAELIFLDENSATPRIVKSRPLEHGSVPTTGGGRSGPVRFQHRRPRERASFVYRRSRPNDRLGHAGVGLQPEWQRQVLPRPG